MVKVLVHKFLPSTLHQGALVSRSEISSRWSTGLIQLTKPFWLALLKFSVLNFRSHFKIWIYIKIRVVDFSWRIRYTPPHTPNSNPGLVGSPWYQVPGAEMCHLAGTPALCFTAVSATPYCFPIEATYIWGVIILSVCWYLPWSKIVLNIKREKARLCKEASFENKGSPFLGENEKLSLCLLVLGT